MENRVFKPDSKGADELEESALISFLSWVLVPSYGPLPRLLVIHDGLGIPQLLELRFRENVERVVDC